MSGSRGWSGIRAAWRKGWHLSKQTQVDVSREVWHAGKIAYDCREKGEAPTVLTIGAQSINVALKVCFATDGPRWTESRRVQIFDDTLYARQWKQGPGKRRPHQFNISRAPAYECFLLHCESRGHNRGRFTVYSRSLPPLSSLLVTGIPEDQI